MSATIISENEDIYIDGVRDAIDYILNVIDKDSDFIYQEKEIIKLFFKMDNFKDFDFNDFKLFISIQQQKNIMYYGFKQSK